MGGGVGLELLGDGGTFPLSSCLLFPEYSHLAKLGHIKTEKAGPISFNIVQVW